MQGEIIAEYFNCIRSHLMNNVIACSFPTIGGKLVSQHSNHHSAHVLFPIYHQMSVACYKIEIWWVEVIEDLIAWKKKDELHKMFMNLGGNYF